MVSGETTEILFRNDFLQAFVVERDDEEERSSLVCWSSALEKSLDQNDGCSLSMWGELPQCASDAQHENAKCSLRLANRSKVHSFVWLVRLWTTHLQVCEVYHLHRETYHLSIAYIDQYLCRTKNLAKQKFQLLGITALFVAAKIEVRFECLSNIFTKHFSRLLGNLSSTVEWFHLRDG